MKKVLLATTALVFSAGFAAAEVTISGSANMGFKYAEDGIAWTDGDATSVSLTDKDAAGWYEIDIDVVGTMESDAGLTFGAKIQLDSDYASALKTGNVEGLKGSVFASGAFGTFTVGTGVDPIADDYGLTDIGFDGIGTDDVGEKSRYTGKADARWDYSVGAVKLGASVNTITEDFGLGAKYDAGMFSAALTFDHDDVNTVMLNDSNDSVALTLAGKMDAFSGQIFVADSDAYNTSWGVYGAYTTGALTIEAAYSDSDAIADEAYGIGAKYDLGGGAKLAGGVGSVGDKTVADLGVTFSF